jgi:hypothetical protein
LPDGEATQRRSEISFEAFLVIQDSLRIPQGCVRFTMTRQN